MPYLRSRFEEAVHGGLAVVVIHGDGGDLLQPQRLADIERGGRALRRAEMHEAEHVVARASDIGMHAIGRDHHDAGLLEYRSGGASRCGIAAIDDELDAIFADQLVGGEDRLVRFGLIVISDELQFLSEHAAGRVDVLDRHLAGDLGGFAVGGRRARQWHLESDLDIGARRHRGDYAKQDEARETQ